MAYITVTNRGTNSAGRPMQDVTINLPAFAADLAKALGGAVFNRPGNDYPNESQYIDIGADRLHVRGDTWKRKVHVYISAPEISHDDRTSMYGNGCKTDDASINPDARPIAAIAKDIKRRVIDASLPALAKQRELKADMEARRGGIAEAMQRLKNLAPSIDIRRESERDQQATVYYSQKGGYFSGRLDHDGSVSLERVSGLNIEKLARVLAILAE